MSTKMAQKTIPMAKLSIAKWPELDRKAKINIIEWLEDQVRFLEKDMTHEKSQISKNYTARCME